MDEKNTLSLEENSSEVDIKTEKSKPFSFCLKGFFAGLLIALAAFFLCVKFAGLKMWQSVLISIGFVLVGALKLENEHKLTKIITWALFILTTLFSFYIVETLNLNSLYNDLTFLQGVLNMVWYSIVLVLIYFVFRRKSLSAIVAMLIFLSIGVANHYVLVFRGTTIFPNDIFAMETAMNVADNFDYTPDSTMVYCFVLCALYAFALIRAKYGWKKDHPSPRFIVITFSAFIAYGTAFFTTDMLRALEIYAQQWKTQANGFVLNFTAAITYSFVDEPKGYRAEIAHTIEDYFSAQTDDGTNPVNVICIMNESFADYSIYEYFSMTEDPMPYYHSLKENTIKGSVYVSVTGGGTANSEFEFLTGNTLAFLPEATVAYQLYFDEKTPASIDEFVSLGYETTAFHPYEASGWNRPMVYEYMNFDQQLYEDDVTKKGRVRKYISDISDYHEIFRLTDECQDDMFVFNVTMQNHSGYSEDWPNLDEENYAAGRYAGKKYTDDLNQYLSLTKESDVAIKELIEHYSNVDEDTLIVFFGDHHPPLSNDFYEDIHGKAMDERSMEEVMLHHKTPFFIWANYDIPEEEGLEMSLNFLMNKTFETAGIPLTEYQLFLNEVKKEIPVINRVGYITKDGEYIEKHEINKLTPKQRELVKMYEYLQYNNIFDNENMPSNFFNY